MVGKLIDLKNQNKPGDNVKLGVGLLAGFAADMVVAGLLKAHMPITKGVIKLLVTFGIFVIAMKAGEEVEEYVVRVWDDTRDSIKEAQEEARKEVTQIIQQNKTATE
ncbi:MAG: hypothetical protein J6U54_18420 [Clostridiales bacterium]|nr:hypothetical protein [Clostridiales bacterium]